MTIFSQIASKIIKEQELIIGPLAWDEARKVHGIYIVDADGRSVEVRDGDDRAIIDNLVKQYERLFGLASREACREAVGTLIAEMQPENIPQSLRG